MAAEHGLGYYGLPGDEEDAEGGDVQPYEPNKESSSQHTEQYCGGSVAREQGIPALPEDSSGFVGRTGDSDTNNSKPSDALEREYGNHHQINSEHEEANTQSDGKNVTRWWMVDGEMVDG